MSLPRFSVNNPVFANLLMVLIAAAGGFVALTGAREMFPEIRSLMIVAGTPYPGASPYEVERGICAKIEEKVADLPGIDTVRSTAREGASGVVMTLLEGTSKSESQRILNDVKGRIDLIDDFPDDAEDTTVTEVEPPWPVIAISLYGDVDPMRLRDAAVRLKDDLQAMDGISDVSVAAVREREIRVEVRPEALLRWNVTFMEIVDAVRRSNLNLPGGTLKTRGGELLVRTVGEARRPEDLERLIVRALPDGRHLTLRELATVRETFKDTSLWGRYKGKPAVSVIIGRRSGEDAIEIADKVRKHLDMKFNRTLPAAMQTDTHRDMSKFIRQRIELMLRNGGWGLLFVFLSLTLFLNLRLSLWVALGLPVSFLGAFMLMPLFGVSINLLSLFGMIVVLGMIVDDAIVVGENVYRHIEMGEEPRIAAIKGTEEVTKPVVTAIVTTIAAFLPLVLMGGRMGQFMWVLPVVVTIALGVSLVEALVILPSHLAEWLVPIPKKDPAPAETGAAPGGPHRVEGRGWTAALRDRLMIGTLIPAYRRILTRAVRWRYVTVAALFALLVIAMGARAAFMNFSPFGGTDADILMLAIEMPVGTRAEETEATLKLIEGKIDEQLSDEKVTRNVRNYFTSVGTQFDPSGGGGMPITPGSNLGQIWLELEESGVRKISSEDLSSDLRKVCAAIPGIAYYKVEPMHGGPGGRAIEIELRGEDLEAVRMAAEEMKKSLSRFPGVYQIADSYRPGKREIVLELKDAARSLGLTQRDLGVQVRGAFYGLEAGEVQQVRDALEINVRFPEENRSRLSDLESLRIATPAGGRVPLGEVARVSFSRGIEKITRTDRKRTVTVMAEVDSRAGPEANAEKILIKIREKYDDIGLRFPGVSMEFKGQARETSKSFGSLLYLFPISLLIIYLVLATLFRSYLQPLVVMVAIPLGFIGVIVGHFIMGYDMSVLSTIGMVALSGIVVNDSLILVDFINRRIQEVDDPVQAVIESGVIRLRPILLTSITTILGLAPLMGETSFQARFLIPMAISITFGLAFATVLLLIAVPCLYLMLLDVQRLIYRIWQGRWPPEGWSPRRGHEKIRAEDVGGGS